MAGFLSLFNEPERIIVAKGFWIDIKTSLTAEDYEAAQRALLGKMSMSGNNLTAEPDTIAYQNELVYRAIVDWNLTDEEGNDLPLTPAKLKHNSISRLPQAVFIDIYERINEASKPRSGEDEIQFRDGGESRDNGNESLGGASVSTEVSN
jgi:hypothetical protein